MKAAKAEVKAAKAEAKAAQSESKAAQAEAKTAKAEATAAKAEATAAKVEVPDAIRKLQKQQETVVQNQQKNLKKAIEEYGAEGKGRHFNELGAEIQDLQTKVATEAAPKGAVIETNPKLAEGTGGRLDTSIESAGTRVLVETKYSLPSKGEGLTRVNKQLENGSKVVGGSDKLILHVAKPPTAAEVAAFKEQLAPSVAGRVQVVTSLEDLYIAVKSAFGQ